MKDSYGRENLACFSLLEYLLKYEEISKHLVCCLEVNEPNAGLELEDQKSE